MTPLGISLIINGGLILAVLTLGAMFIGCLFKYFDLQKKSNSVVKIEAHVKDDRQKLEGQYPEEQS